MNSKLERRLEVAAEFRNLGETGSAAEILDKPIRYQMGFQAIKAVIGKGDCFELLADLIEPDTCVMSFVEEEAMQATYRCSYCHNTVDTLALFGYKFQFCPHCGAKITSVARPISLVLVAVEPVKSMSMMPDILIGTAAINRALDATERRADA